MNIKITDSWLREFIETKATPEQIDEYLSLCSQSVEKIIKEGKDFVYDIEITTNRPDCLSVYGIARELAAILPRFNIQASLKDVPVGKIPSFRHSDQAKRVEESLDGVCPVLAEWARDDTLPLTVKIAKPDLCPRFTALIYNNIKIKPSPEFAQKRLNQSGIRALNNVVDISNYLMLELGQPMHTFDYDKILKHKMILRESKAGEEIITLDGQKRILKEDIIVIEDGKGRIVDLCGIMGAENSETDENTKRVLLFVQTYNPMKIRRACQTLGFRTEAASRFEKGIDPEGVSLAMHRATLLFDEWCEGKVASELFDIYPKPIVEKTVSVTKQKIIQAMGIDIGLEESAEILSSLGFNTEIDEKKAILRAIVPHWRNGDIDIPEDLVEEIARIFGYHNLPNVLPPISTLNFQKETIFDWEDKIKTALKYWGFTEVMSYSLVSKNLAITSANPLKIANPLTEDLLLLRTSLIPSLWQIISDNQAENKEIKIFEMANVYLPQSNAELPKEIMTLTLVQTGENKYLQIKGILETLLKELGIENWEIEPGECLNLNKYGLIKIREVTVGIIGEVKTEKLLEFNIKEPVVVVDIEIAKLLSFATKVKKYTPTPKYPPIIEDLSFVFPPQTPIRPVIEEIKKTSETVRNAELIDSYQNTKTFRITYQHPEKSLTDKEVGKVRERIIEKINQNFQGKLKG